MQNKSYPIENDKALIVLKNYHFYPHISRIIVLLFLLVFFWGCSTQNNTWLNRNYHTISAKYNGFWNARESFNHGVEQLSKAHEDNYEQILSIFRYGDEQQARSIQGNMDVAYEKASIVIRRHSMNIRGVEYNKWIDESYFLIARSHFFKRDYNLAILTFEYIIRQYDTDRAYESKVWIAKAYNKQGRYNNALQMLEVARADYRDGKLSDEGERLYQLAFADYHIRQENYMDAVPFLERGIKKTRSRRERSRLTFIKAQLYHHSEDYARAQQTYSRVLRMNPTFDMAFQARINMAMAFDPATGNSEDIRSGLKSMLRDDKNRDYRDQIYYALAELSRREGNTSQAIDYYKQSTAVSDGNNTQKGLSYLRLGEIYFERPQYLQASKYYDSTITFLPQNFENYSEISRKQTILSDLARNIKIIEREDSLQHLASLSSAERNAIVDQVIAKIREEEQRKREEERQRMQTAQQMARSRRPGGDDRGGGWYFYNPSAISFGQTEFYAKFGERPREDLWRISNKQTVSFDFDDGEWDDPDSLDEDGSPLDRNRYLRNIPTTSEMMAQSNDRIAQAYYDKGMIFKDRLNNYPNAIESLKSLVSRFPETERKLYSYYFLYNLNKEIGNHSEAQNFKNRLINEFPDSDFAKILGDPDYIENLRKREEYANRLYSEAYNAFFSENYDLVKQHSKKVDTMDISPDLRSRFSYLKALSVGKTGSRQQFRHELENILIDFEGFPVHERATDLLASLDNNRLFHEQEDDVEEVIADAEYEEFVSVFSFEEESAHFFVFVVDVLNIEPAQLRSFINEFNKDSFPDRELSLSNIFLDERRQITTITNFSDKEKGMEYYNAIMESDRIGGFDPEALKGFVISVENYPIFYQERNLDEYLEFFRIKYLKK